VVLLCANTGFTKLTQRKAAKGDPEKPLYEQLDLGAIGLNRDAFEKALLGFKKLSETEKLANCDLLSIADLSQSANNKRLYVIDLARKMVLFHTYVSHGRNSGEEYASSFGNKDGSYKSSLGFFLTGSVYDGQHGTSLRLLGMEQGINHRALDRGIVVHGANYVSEEFIRSNGRLGRSQGCPAVPEKECRPIVERIKEGSCFYIYYPDSNYFGTSDFFH
jgi:hypothetical protein